MTVHLVVTLVHGTWAPDAPWTQDDSPLCAHLRGAFGPGVVFHRVRWSGGNYAAARLNASQRLRGSLLAAFEAHPDAQHAIIAHSHGGNVAMYVLRERDVAQRVTALVTLATPFIHVDAPVWPARVAHHVVLYMVFAPPSLAIYGAILLAPGPLEERARSLGWMALSSSLHDGGIVRAVINLLLIFLPLAFTFHGRALTRGLLVRVARLRRSARLPSAVACPTLILRSTGDEASLGLAFVRLLSGAAGRLAAVFVRVLDVGAALDYNGIRWRARRTLDGARSPSGHVGTAMSRFITFGVYLALFIAFVSIFPVTPFSFSNLLAIVLAAAGIAFLVKQFLYIAGSVFLRAFVGICLLAVQSLRGLFLVPFGFDLALASVALDASAEATPPGTWTVEHVPSSRMPRPTIWPGLVHSRLYASQAGLAAIQRFMEDAGVQRVEASRSALGIPDAEAETSPNDTTTNRFSGRARC